MAIFTHSDNICITLLATTSDSHSLIESTCPPDSSITSRPSPSSQLLQELLDNANRYRHYHPVGLSPDITSIYCFNKTYLALFLKYFSSDYLPNLHTTDTFSYQQYNITSLNIACSFTQHNLTLPMIQDYSIDITLQLQCSSSDYSEVRISRL